MSLTSSSISSSSTSSDHKLNDPVGKEVPITQLDDNQPSGSCHTEGVNVVVLSGKEEDPAKPLIKKPYATTTKVANLNRTLSPANIEEIHGIIKTDVQNVHPQEFSSGLNILTKCINQECSTNKKQQLLIVPIEDLEINGLMSLHMDNKCPSCAIPVRFEEETFKYVLASCQFEMTGKSDQDREIIIIGDLQNNDLLAFKTKNTDKLSLKIFPKYRPNLNISGNPTSTPFEGERLAFLEGEIKKTQGAVIAMKRAIDTVSDVPLKECAKTQRSILHLKTLCEQNIALQGVLITSLSAQNEKITLLTDMVYRLTQKVEELSIRERHLESRCFSSQSIVQSGSLNIEANDHQAQVSSPSSSPDDVKQSSHANTLSIIKQIQANRVATQQSATSTSSQTSHDDFFDSILNDLKNEEIV